MQQTANKKRHAGFTLIEIMVVIVILGILAALIVPKVMSRPDEARIVAAKQDINSIVHGRGNHHLRQVAGRCFSRPSVPLPA